MQTPKRSQYSVHWSLDPACVFLNHGSFGACPHPIFNEREKWQKEIMKKWQEEGYAEFYSEKPISCKDPDLTQVFTKPSELTGVVYELISREGDGFCKDSVKSLMESTKL